MFWGTWLHINGGCLTRPVAFEIPAESIAEAVLLQVSEHSGKVIFQNKEIAILEIAGMKRLGIADAPLGHALI